MTISVVFEILLLCLALFCYGMALYRTVHPPRPAITRPRFDPAALAVLEHEIAFDPVHDPRDTSGIEPACPVCHPPRVVRQPTPKKAIRTEPNRQLSMPHMPGMDVSALTTDELLRIADRMADHAERSADLGTKRAMIALLKVIEAEVKSRKYG